MAEEKIIETSLLLLHRECILAAEGDRSKRVSFRRAIIGVALGRSEQRCAISKDRQLDFILAAGAAVAVAIALFIAVLLLPA